MTAIPRIHHHLGITFEAYAKQWVDMVPHAATLTALAGECKSIVEFGVRGGVSTWALLDGLPADGWLTSFDPDEQVREMTPPHIFVDPRFTFVCADDTAVVMPEHADMVMIDSSHQYEHTVKELRIAEKMTPHWIVLHDYYDPPHPGVRKAVDEFVALGSYVIEDVEESQWGLAILRAAE